MKNLSKDMFERVAIDLSLQEKIERPSLTYWQDARKRLLKNKGAIIGMVTLIIIIIMAIAGPYMNEYSYDRQIQPISRNNLLPPRIPVLEKIGIFDGTLIRDVGANRLSQYNENEYTLLGTIETTNTLEVPEVSLGRYPEGSYEILNVIEENNAKIYQIAVTQTSYRIRENTYVVKGVDNSYFWFGTDDLARDIWTRVWNGARISLYIGLLAAIIDMLIGVIYGSIAGFFGGKIDMYMMRFIEILSGIPSLVIIILFILVMDPGILPISLAIAITGWMGMARVVRAQFLKLKSQEYVLAARTLGASNFSLIKKHLLPNIVGQVIIMITFSIPGAIFYEAFLAFIGLGVPAPHASLGVLISDGVSTLRSYPSMLFIPTAVLCLLMLSINILANGLRDALDPKMRNK
ncbi:oligopeptide transport system permease protein [Natranaerovirga pectinivora]|uniref:Oligopeptide transport system permease protein n=1 Tax=Natranaerovirga pectinivora TaxID=682400 RepID=A0A4R3MI75_9FIRM|nr:oligopeptide ABC transporter permease [Natranaerovirga pectinivora]TCT12147.1 oligopeptide transport system permease protein [Natranaerovirga pectinivora]